VTSTAKYDTPHSHERCACPTLQHRVLVPESLSRREVVRCLPGLLPRRRNLGTARKSRCCWL
jgi:hypothetical protein